MARDFVTEPSQAAPVVAAPHGASVSRASLASSFSLLAEAADFEGKDAWRDYEAGLNDGKAFAYRDAVSRLLAEREQGLERVRHVKRGTEYEVLGEAEFQLAACNRITGDDYYNPDATYLREGDKFIIYRGDDGKIWARSTDEFRDGRFVTIRALASADRSGEADATSGASEGESAAPKADAKEILHADPS